MLDASFIGVIVGSLALLSLLTGLRMRAAGAGAWQVVTVLAELWAVFLVWIAVLSVASRGGRGYPAALEWFHHLSLGGKALTVLAVLFSIGLFVHLQLTIRRTMSATLGRIEYEDEDKGDGKR
jgi:hypothetical protein